MSAASTPQWILDVVAQVRRARRRQGHALTALQAGIAEAVAASNPMHNPDSHKELMVIQAAILTTGRWNEAFEWRISTWLDLTIARSTEKAADAYEVVVECDGQRLSCTCPTIEGAYAFMRLYQALVIDQFYSIGPPWADTGIFKS